MKTNLNFDHDPEIAEILGKIRRIRNLDLDLDELLEPGVSSFELRRRARAHYRSYRALRLSALAKERREDLEYKWCKEEAARIEQIVQDVSKSVDCFPNAEDDDGESFREYVLNRLVDYFDLVGIDDEHLKMAFQNRKLYFYLNDDHPGVKRDRDFYTNAIERFCAPSA